MFGMSTRNTANLPSRLDRCTEFQFHLESVQDGNVFDFTEKKLIKFISNVSDPQQRLTLCALIDDYRKGLIAVAWKHGSPTWLKITKDS